MTRACSDAVRPGTCTTAPSDSEATAHVHWASDTIVDVTLKSADGALSSRRIVFRQDDAESDRWQAIGLVVASLSTGDGGEPPHDARPRVVLPPRRAVWIGVGALAGNGIHPGPARYGGWLRAGYQIASLPAFVSLGIGYAVSPTTGSRVTPDWAAFSTGGGAMLESKSLRLVLRPALEVAIERVEARSNALAVPTSGSRWLSATQASFTVTWPAHEPVAAVAGAMAAFATGATGIRAGGAEIASFPALSYAGLLGIEVSFSN